MVIFLSTILFDAYSTSTKYLFYFSENQYCNFLLCHEMPIRYNYKEVSAYQLGFFYDRDNIPLTPYQNQGDLSPYLWSFHHLRWKEAPNYPYPDMSHTAPVPHHNRKPDMAPDVCQNRPKTVPILTQSQTIPIPDR